MENLGSRKRGLWEGPTSLSVPQAEGTGQTGGVPTARLTIQGLAVVWVGALSRGTGARVSLGCAR